jgi:hypothetical protein
MAMPDIVSETSRNRSTDTPVSGIADLANAGGHRTSDVVPETKVFGTPVLDRLPYRGQSERMLLQLVVHLFAG